MSSTQIQRPTAEQKTPFWPLSRTRLNVTVEAVNDMLDVKGFDPDLANTEPVFVAEILSEQQSAFLEAVRIGVEGVDVTSASNDNVPASAEPPQANTVVVSDPGPGDGNGPKLWRITLPTVSAAKTQRPTGT